MNPKLKYMEPSHLIEQVHTALKTTLDPEERFSLQNYLVELYRKNNREDDAISLLESLISSHSDAEPATLAALYNNLGILQSSGDIKKAIAALKEADRYYRENTDQNTERLALVNYQLSQLYTELKDGYYTKKYLKEAIMYFERITSGQVYEAQARAHDQLAHIYSEKLQLFDARTQFKKALDLYRAIYPIPSAETGLVVGGVLNNLGVTYRQMDSFQQAESYFTETLEYYESLAASSDEFLPWVGSTLTNLGNLYAEQNSMEKAREFAERALQLYKHLSEEQPELYEHYLATSLHNSGLLYMEEDPETAESFFRKAIGIREDLATKEPEAFNADLAASLMNLVELYHARWELTLKKELKNKGLALLAMVRKKADLLSKQHPAIQNILNDLSYYENRFRNEDLSGLHFLKVTRETMLLKEEVNATILPGEKIPYQDKIVRALRSHVLKYPGHYRGLEAFSEALSEQAWYYLRMGKLKKANALIREMRQLKSDLSPEAKCNLAHYYLLCGDDLKATEFYKQVLPLKNEDNRPVAETLNKDFRILKSDGVLGALPPAVEKLMAGYS